MTRALRLALLVSLSLHLSVVFLYSWLSGWAKGVTVRESGQPTKPLPIAFSLRLKRPPLAPPGTAAEAPKKPRPPPVPEKDNASSAAAEHPKVNEYASRLIAPRFISPPDLSFLEVHPQQLSLKLEFRLFVNSLGITEKIERRGVMVAPAHLLTKLEEVLQRNQMYPAMQDGKPIASYIDIIIGSEPEIEEPFPRQP